MALSTRGFSCRSVRKVLKNRRVVEFMDVATVRLVGLIAPLSTTQKRAALTKCLSHLFSRRILIDNSERPPKGSTRKKPSAAPSTEGTATPQIPVSTIWPLFSLLQLISLRPSQSNCPSYLPLGRSRTPPTRRMPVAEPRT